MTLDSPASPVHMKGTAPERRDQFLFVFAGRCARRRTTMLNWRPDQTFYPSPRMAMQAAQENLAYVAMLDPTRKKPDALGIVDVEPTSKHYGKLVGRLDMPNTGDELHHFGWNACSSCLCPYSPHPHMERRYF